jgi:hypothetical protein
MTRRGLPLILALLVGSPALADPPCGSVEVRFKPGGKRMQIVVWIEDSTGKVIATPYITRTTGTFGLGNRPGANLLKSNFGWPYGRREMVAPIWAHRRDKHYPRVVMGGSLGNKPSPQCPDNQCLETSIAYHERVSSDEPYYCPPMAIPDAMSCASRFNGSKGAYADQPAFSLYPPRADLTAFNPAVDSTNLTDFKNQNDLVAVSAATPLPNQVIVPTPSWWAAGMPAGDYVAWVELSQEFDGTPGHDVLSCHHKGQTSPPCSNEPPDHPCMPDKETSWDWEGFCFLGQPSVVYRVPFRYDVGGGTAIATQFHGYSTWNGQDGTIHPPDGTIVTNKVGSGAGRLVDVDDGVDVYRVKTVVGNCMVLPTDGGLAPPDAGVTDGGVNPTCESPSPVANLDVTAGADKLKVKFNAPAGGPAPLYYEVRYQVSQSPITGASFSMQLPAPNVAHVSPGKEHEIEITGLKVDVSYAVAVRGVVSCGSTSSVVSRVAATSAKNFAVLHGCFVATAAFGTPMAAQVQMLRDFRDHHLLNNPAGRLLTAIYYAFSPPLARAIDTDENLRALARAAIAPLVGAR